LLRDHHPIEQNNMNRQQYRRTIEHKHVLTALLPKGSAAVAAAVKFHLGPIVKYVLTGPPVDADEYPCVESPVVDGTFQRFMAAIIESARFTKCKKSGATLFASDSLIGGAAVMALGAPCYRCRCM
jgi:hypothetical protein